MTRKKAGSWRNQPPGRALQGGTDPWVRQAYAVATGDAPDPSADTDTLWQSARNGRPTPQSIENLRSRGVRTDDIKTYGEAYDRVVAAEKRRGRRSLIAEGLMKQPASPRSSRRRRKADDAEPNTPRDAGRRRRRNT